MTWHVNLGAAPIVLLWTLVVLNTTPSRQGMPAMSLTDTESKPAFHQTQGLTAFEYAAIGICRSICGSALTIPPGKTTRTIVDQTDRQMCARAVDMAHTLFAELEKDNPAL